MKTSSHGLGHLLSPFSTKEQDVDWNNEMWLDILKIHYGLISTRSINQRYGFAYGVARLSISTPTIIRRFSRLNAGKTYSRQIKPFNFCVVGIGNFIDPQSGEVVKPLSPYRKNAQQCVFDEFIDYNTGKKHRGHQYWKRFADIFFEYVNHPEAKFDGKVGILSRKHVAISSIVHIGKESNNLEQAEVLGVRDDDYVVYGNSAEQLLAHRKRILLTEPKDVKPFWISRQTLRNAKHALLTGKVATVQQRTVKQLLAYAYTMIQMNRAYIDATYQHLPKSGG